MRGDDSCHTDISGVRGGFLGRLWRRLRDFLAAQAELHERMVLLKRPWEEEFLHWAFDGQQWQLHGTVVPPPGRRGRSVTRGGWCPGLRDVQQHGRADMGVRLAEPGRG